MQNVKAKGILSHHFWGTYSATIGLEFQDEKSAIDAQNTLNKANPVNEGEVKAWILGKKNKNVLVFYGKEDLLDNVIETLVGFGANRDKITSVVKSIDYGEPFNVTVPVTPIEQEKLFPV